MGRFITKYRWIVIGILAIFIYLFIAVDIGEFLSVRRSKGNWRKPYK